MRQNKPLSLLIFIVSLFLFSQSAALAQTPADFKVAFIGDSGASGNFQQVLNLIKNEGTDMVLHQGDFDYSDGVDVWKNMVNTTLGADFPYLGSDGNHDNWDTEYADFFRDRLVKMGNTPPAGNLSSNYSAVYQGIKMVFTQEGGNPSFITNQLANDSNPWKICSWHKNMIAMQVGGKGNDQGWGDYEECRKAGAIIVTGHEHTYERTKTLVSTQNQTVDPTCSDPNNLCLSPGKTFVVVSGIGGKSIRSQRRCLPTTYPYGCNGEWAKIYTSDQGADYGALFITFNYQGNPDKAHGIFKNIAGQVVDEFDITKGTAPPPPAGTPTPTPLTQITPTPTAPQPWCTPPPCRSNEVYYCPGTCPNGCGTICVTPTTSPPIDGQCDPNNPGTLVCFEIWRREYTGVQNTKTTDFNSDGRVDLIDFEIWRREFTGSISTPIPTSYISPTSVPTLPLTTASPTQPSTGELDIAVCDPANGPFSLTIDNNYMPFPVGMVHVLEDANLKVQVSVLNQTEVVAGVTTRVVEEREWENNQLIEISRNFFVQAPDKTVCYYGEDVDIYQGGQIVGHSGAWRAGVGQNRPGIVMPGSPAVGQTYQQEVAPGVAMDRAEHIAFEQSYNTPAGTFNNVLYVKETPPSDKRYAPGVGMIFDDGILLTSY